VTDSCRHFPFDGAPRLMPHDAHVVDRPAAELDARAIAEHERVVILYRETYREQEPLHAPRFGQT